MAWEAQAISTNETFRLENFTYSNVVIRNVIFGHLEQTNFTGVSVSEICRAQAQAPHSTTYWISGWFGLLTRGYMFLDFACSVSTELCVSALMVLALCSNTVMNIVLRPMWLGVSISIILSVMTLAYSQQLTI